MKKAFLTVAICFAGLATFAQSRPLGSELSIGAEGALPLNGFRLEDGQGVKSDKISNFGLGGTVKYAYNFDETIAVTLQSGYIYFFGKDLGGGKINLSQIPIKAGVRYSMGQFYVEPQLGVGFYKPSIKITSGTSTTVNFDSYSAFTYAGNIGVLASQNFDISLRYEGWSKNGSAGFLGLRLAYVFPLK